MKTSLTECEKKVQSGITQRVRCSGCFSQPNLNFRENRNQENADTSVYLDILLSLQVVGCLKINHCLTHTLTCYKAKCGSRSSAGQVPGYRWKLHRVLIFR